MCSINPSSFEGRSSESSSSGMIEKLNQAQILEIFNSKKINSVAQQAVACLAHTFTFPTGQSIENQRKIFQQLGQIFEENSSRSDFDFLDVVKRTFFNYLVGVAKDDGGILHGWKNQVEGALDQAVLLGLVNATKSW